MRVAVDARPIGPEEVGPGIYTRLMIEHMSALAPDWTFHLYWAKRAPGTVVPGGPNVRARDLGRRGGRKLGNLLFEQILLPAASRQEHCDLLWSPANRMRFVFEDNAPEDILAVTEEMMARLDGSFIESDEDRTLQARYFARFPAGHWSAQVRTPMGRDFLAKHQAYFLES